MGIPDEWALEPAELDIMEKISAGKKRRGGEEGRGEEKRRGGESERESEGRRGGD